jgi:hypothetical protein
MEELLMKLICPACGAIASAETWINDELSRETLARIVELKAPLPKSVLGYMSLFRPGKTGLAWKKALRLAEEIATLTGCGYVKNQGKIDRDCPPRIWAMAMDQMTERRAGLSLPLKNHNYLRQVAWQLADQADAQAEKSGPNISRKFATGGFVPRTLGMDPLNQYIQGLRDTKPTDEEMAEWKKKHQR